MVLLRELDAVSGARAVVRIPREEPATGEHLPGFRVAGQPTVGVMRLRAAVHQHDERVARARLISDRRHQEHDPQRLPQHRLDPLVRHRYVQLE